MNNKIIAVVVVVIVAAAGISAAVLLNDDGSGKEPGKTTEEDGAWPRTYVDALGREVVLEQKPERTALIFFRGFEYMLMLDEVPVAAAMVEEVYNGWTMLEPFADEYYIIELGGDQYSPNLDLLAITGPDLIITYTGIFEGVGEQLEKIATTITVDTYGDDWQTPFIQYGEIFGKEEKAQEEIERLEGLLGEAVEDLSPYSDKTFAFLRPDGKNMFTVYVLQYVYDAEVGLGLSAPEGYMELSRKQIDLSGLTRLNPDYIFLYDNALTSVHEGYLEELGSNSVWNALESVKSGNVYFIDRSAFSGGPLSIEYGVNKILEDVIS